MFKQYNQKDIKGGFKKILEAKGMLPSFFSSLLCHVRSCPIGVNLQEINISLFLTDRYVRRNTSEMQDQVSV